jgi:hypothetical protein
MMPRMVPPDGELDKMSVEASFIARALIDSVHRAGHKAVKLAQWPVQATVGNICYLPIGQPVVAGGPESD